PGLSNSVPCGAAPGLRTRTARIRQQSCYFLLKDLEEYLHDFLLSIFLGIVEGLTEFLPVSSTAHLRIAEELLGISLSSGFWKMYSIVIQLGAILCLPIYFGPRILQFLRSFPRGERQDRTAFNHPLTLVLIAFLCTAVPSYLLTE